MRGRVGMHQRALRHEARRAAGGGQRHPAAEDLEAVGRQVAQHQHQRRLVDVLDAAGHHAHADAADPVHAGPALLQLGQQTFGLRRVGLGQVDQAQRRDEGRPPRGAAGVDLRGCQRQRHAGVRMGGMGGDEGLHPDGPVSVSL